MKTMKISYSVWDSNNNEWSKFLTIQAEEMNSDIENAIENLIRVIESRENAWFEISKVEEI